MTGIKSFDKFLEFFNTNASGVIGTITNQPFNFQTKGFSDFKIELLESNVLIPCVIITINFVGSNDFQIQIITSKKVISSLADLMMLGTGDVEYSPEEHHDGIQEMLNQVLGSMTAELHADGITASGSVTEIALSDMEIHKDFLQDNKMVEISFELLGVESFMYLLAEPATLTTIDTLFSDAPAKPTVTTTQSSASAPKEKKAQQEPVAVSRASFAEIEEVRPTSSKGVNIDILLHIDLPVTVELGSKDMRIKEILDLGQGSVVELNKLAGDLVDLKINGKKFATGEVMVVDENYAIRIVNLISREERIRSLGPE